MKRARRSSQSGVSVTGPCRYGLMWVELALQAGFPELAQEVVPAADVHRAAVVVDDLRVERAPRSFHVADVAFQLGPVREAQLARDAVLRLCELERRRIGESRGAQATQRVGVSGLRGLQQVLRALVLLL